MSPLVWLLCALALFFIGICSLAIISDNAEYENE